jgi:Phosphotransferase enzyme family
MSDSSRRCGFRDALALMGGFVPITEPGAQLVAEQKSSAAPLAVLMTDEGYARDLLSESIPELSAGAWKLLSCEVHGVKEKMRKVIASYDVTYADERDGTPRTEGLIAKVYGTDRGQRGHDALRTLWQAGFRSPARFRVPRPYGYSADRTALIQERAEGTPWADFLGGGRESLERASNAAADWLVRLQSSGVIGEAVDPGRQRADVCRFARELGGSFPEHADRLERLGKRLSSQLRTDGASLVPSHGDYHPENVLIAPARVTVIDCDAFGLREPAFDVGYAICQLLVMAVFRLGDLGAGLGAAASFWRRYRQRGPASWGRVKVQIARSFLQSLHYELYTLRTPQVELLSLWPDLIERSLRSHDQASFEDSLRRR